jgi:integrase
VFRYGIAIGRCERSPAADLRGAEWSEIDFEHAEWRIPTDRMNMRATRIVPLSRQALTIVEQLKCLTGGGSFLFPN